MALEFESSWAADSNGWAGPLTGMRAEGAFWAVVPAAGAGRRMGAELPKQYLPLLGRPVIAHVLDALAAHARVRGIVAVLAEDDRWWAGVGYRNDKLLAIAPGGETRALSVASGIAALLSHAGPQDWVLVHDAARACVPRADLDALMDAAADDHGALLAVPIHDTVKRADAAGRVTGTVDRRHLWRALTPQCFPIRILAEALAQAQAAGVEVTDEAMAMERAGYRPQLVAGSAQNIKITVPADLALAEYYLKTGS
jgi:2-C-methyl-D-erythritol 4-phosphate cytidylyltransferase